MAHKTPLNVWGALRERQLLSTGLKGNGTVWKNLEVKIGNPCHSSTFLSCLLAFHHLLSLQNKMELV